MAINDYYESNLIYNVFNWNVTFTVEIILQKKAFHRDPNPKH